ncbi:unnamed protein product [Adineta ricciae]|uniref:Uncharacterized protein n=1 Tax=Adineta ricciae TaxID=249248 RepID=A0A815IEB6_ADIRI|nr:unnamed protein product [Adineta ricciae]
MLRSQDNQQQLIPLKKVSVVATIRSFAADVTITQLFRNDETTHIEAVYCFPIEEQAAIYNFTARIDDREIIAQLKEKATAQKEYSQALQSGHGAYLLEQDEKSQDNFIINVGALPPGKECEVVISYVTELSLVEDGKKIRFVVPTTIAPRYNPSQGGLGSPAGTTSKYVQSTPYTIDYHCQVEKFEIAGISSPSHPIQIDFSQQDFYNVTFAQQNTHLDRDIIVDTQLAESRSNTILAVESNAVMASFTPNEQDCQRTTDNKNITNEFIFVVDCSGSMDEENKIELARQAMLLFLKSLPVNCHFNIVRFGSNHQSLFPETTAVYNEVNAQNAEQLTKTMKADLGGTELLSPLQWLDRNPPVRGRSRQIFLLTDGEISDVDQVVDLCRTMATSTRIFSFGLGSSPSRSLVKGLARATNGRFVFIPPNTSVDIHVGEQLQKALQPCITDVQVKWHLDTATAITTVPTKTPPVYINDRLIVYALADNASIRFDHNARVELISAQHRIGEAKVTRIPNVSNNETIARLAAKALILELQHQKLPSSKQKLNTGSLQARFQKSVASNSSDDETTKELTKKRIIELSLRYNILSPHTAFIGVEKRVNASNVDMVLREVPIQIATDDQHLYTHSNALMLNALDFDDYCDSENAALSPINALQSLSHRSLSGNRYLSTDIDMYCMSIPLPDADDDDDEEEDDDENLFSCQSMPQNTPFQTFIPTSAADLSVMRDEDIVRYLIDKQKFNGSWQLDETDIQKLTGKPWNVFQYIAPNEVLTSAIIILILETRFTSFSMMWHGIAQKARTYLLDLLDKDMTKVNALLEDIRKQL